MDFSNSTLESLRLHRDELADAAVREIMENKEVSHVNQVFHSLIHNDQMPERFSPAVDRYFQEACRLPKDVDWDLLKVGQEVFTMYGPTVFMVLFAKALPECYSCWRGAEVLYRTGRMADRQPNSRIYSRRLMETAQFVVDIMAEKGLQPQGRGIASLRKIRLIHASIRYYLLQTDWEVEKFGLPINQEDELGTLMAFSVSIIEGMEQLELNLSEEEKEGYYYLWYLAGTMMNLAPEVLPSTLEGGRALKKAILEHQRGPSEAGKVLTAAAIEYMNSNLPGSLFKNYPAHLMHFLVGDEIADTLNIEDKEETIAAIGLRVYQYFNRSIHFLEESSSTVRGLSGYFQNHLLESILTHFNEHKNIHFSIPPSLRQNWEEGASSHSNNPET